MKRASKRDAVAKTKVHIIAGGSKSKNVNFEIFDDPAVEVWGLNAIRFDWVLRWDRMFNLHRYDLLLKYGWPVEREAAWAATHRNIPFYTLVDDWPAHWLPCHRIFPQDRLFAMPRGRYHQNSCDMMLTFAIMESFKEIHCHGVNLALNAVAEQMSARACFEYWAGYAEGKGISVTMAKDCDMFHSMHIVMSDRIYGYDDCPVYEDRTANARKGAPYRFDE